MRKIRSGNSAENREYPIYRTFEASKSCHRQSLCSRELSIKDVLHSKAVKCLVEIDLHQCSSRKEEIEKKIGEDGKELEGKEEDKGGQIHSSNSYAHEARLG